MTARRIAAGTLAVGLAVGSAVLGVPAAVAAPAPTYVGIVIEGSGSGCVKWYSGITGDAVLRAVATVKYRPDGLIVQIDGRPASAKADANHYWEYWRTTGSSWTYSSSGASGTTPPAGSVEGWAFTTDGAERSPSASPSGLYRSLCGSKDVTSAPAPVRTSAAPVAPRSRQTRPPTFGPGTPRRASTPALPGATSAVGGPTPAPTTTPSPAGARFGVSSSAGPVGGSASAVFSPAVPGRVDATPASATPASKSDSGSLLPVVLVAGLVVILGGGAGLTVLRRRRADTDL